MLDSLTFPVRDGIQVDQYQILQKLGAGGMGIVYKAFDLQLKRQVAIKFLHKQGEGSQGVNRFLREMEVTSQLSHPNIVKVFHVGSFQTFPYFVMEYVSGLPLHIYCRQNKPDLATRIALLEKVALALAHAHDHGVIHRDIKPANIMVRDNGEPVLMDFGLARVNKTDNRTLTRTGEVIGTPEYMPPEQARGLRREIDAQSDVYGLGAVLYHLLTGVPPVDGETLMEKIYKIIDSKPTPPRRLAPDVPAALEKICLHAMEKKKHRRYAGALAMALDLRNYLQGKTTQAHHFYARRQTTAGVLFASLVAVLAAAAIWGWQWLSPVAMPEIDYAQEVLVMYEKARAKMAANPQEAYFYLEHMYSLCKQNKAKIDNNDKLRLMQRNLRHDMLQAAFAAGDHNNAYALGKDWVAAGKPEVAWQELWIMAQSAYHIGLYDEATAYLDVVTAIAERTPQPEMRAWRAEIAYYHGLLHFQRQRFVEARGALDKALSYLQPGQEQLRARICLYYCALILTDLDSPLVASERNTLSQYWPAVEASRQWLGGQGRAWFVLCEETAARYFLHQASLAATREEREQQANKVVQTVHRLLATEAAKGSWYYIRGKAYALLASYRQAEQDLDMALRLEPFYFGPLQSKLDLLWLHPQVHQVREYIGVVRNYVGRGVQDEAMWFPREFAQLRQQYQNVEAQPAQGIPFSEKTFAEYYRQYREKSEAVRTVARTALACMVPQTAVADVLRQKAESAAREEKKWCQEILHLMTIRQDQQKRQQFLRLLTQIPFRGKVLAARAFYPDYLSLLYDTLDSSADLYLRFLAAKVLACLPVLDIRRTLCERYLRQLDVNDQQCAINVVLVSKALQEIGYNYFFLHPYLLSAWRQQFTAHADWLAGRTRGEIELVLVLLAETLPIGDADTTDICCRLLQHDSTKVRLAALSRLALEDDSANKRPEIGQQMAKTIGEIFASADKEILAFLLDILASHLDIRSPDSCDEWLKLIKPLVLTQQGTERLVNAVSSDVPQLQIAALHFWRELSSHESALPAEIFAEARKAIRPLWRDPYPMKRYLAMQASSQLWDEEVMEQIGYDTSLPMMERTISLFTGLQKTPTRRYQASKRFGWFIQRVEKHDLWNDKVWVIPSFLIMAISREGRGLLSEKIRRGLESSNPYVRFITASSAVYLARLPDSWRRQLQKMAESDPVAYIRPAAWGSLLHCAQREKWPELAAMHKQVKSYQGADWQDYRLAAAWGYGVPWEPLYRQYAWEQELTEESHWGLFAGQLRDDRLAADLQERLDLIRDMLNDMPDHPFYRDCLYFTAQLLEKRGFYQESLALADSMRGLAAQDPRFIDIWSKVAVQLGQHRRVATEISALLQNVSASKEVPEGFDCPYESMLRRISYQLAELGNQSGDSGRWLLEQYLLAPRYPASQFLIGEHYFRRQDYAMAKKVFRELLRQSISSPDCRFWMALIYAKKKDTVRAIRYLRLWWGNRSPLSVQQLQPYPELKELLESPDFINEWNSSDN